MKQLFVASALLLALASCGNRSKTEASVKKDSIAAKAETMNFSTQQTIKSDTVTNGEQIERYDNGVIKLRGMMKDGQRDGLWKSWYNDGSPWSETTFANGKKEGKTTSWYENGQVRYTGFYTNDMESGKWSYWDEKGNKAADKDFGKK